MVEVGVDLMTAVQVDLDEMEMLVEEDSMTGQEVDSEAGEVREGLDPAVTDTVGRHQAQEATNAAIILVGVTIIARVGREDLTTVQEVHNADSKLFPFLSFVI